MRHRLSLTAAALVSVLLAVAGNLLTNTISVPQVARPWLWALVVLLAVLAVGHEVRGGAASEATGYGSVREVSLAQVADQLAEAVRSQWRQEEDRRRINDPFPLPVRWQLSDDALSDHWANVRRAPAGVDPGPLSLAGQLSQAAKIYQRIPSGRLVVLGRAGSGKTILAIRLICGLLETRENGGPVPVIFSLGSWNPATTSLTDWMTEQLIRDHPGLSGAAAGGRLGAALITSGRILPVLDGFDEIAADLRPAALSALNATTMAVVVTSRVDAYTAATQMGGVLAAAATVELADLAPADVVAYLPRTTRRGPAGHDGGTIWDPVLTRLQHGDDPAAARLGAALSTPLMVVLARAVYSDSRNSDPADLLDSDRFRTVAAIEEHLLGAFIPAAYAWDQATGRGRRRQGSARAEGWLEFLAWHLCQEGSADIAWWQFNRRAPRSVHAILGGVPFGLSVGLLLGVGYGGAIGLSGGIGALLVTGVPGGLVSWRAITPSTVRLRLRRTARQYLQRFRFGSLVGVPAGLIAGLLEAVTHGSVTGAWVGLSLAAALTMALGLRELLDARADLATAESPASMLRADLLSGAVHGLSGVGIGAALAIALTVADGAGAGLIAALVYGIAYGFAFAVGLRSSRLSTASYSYLVAHAWLAASGRLPWSFMAFLEDAHRRGILRQDGAVYQFRHARLQARLADAAVRQVSSRRGPRPGYS